MTKSPFTTAEELLPYLRIRGPQSLPEGRENRPPERLAFDRYRHVDLPWELLGKTRLPRLSFQLAAFRSFIEASWPVPSWEPLLAPFVATASKARPWYRLTRRDSQGLLPPSYETLEDGELVLHDGRGNGYVFSAAKDERDKLQTDLLAGGKPYLDAWDKEGQDIFEVSLAKPSTRTRYEADPPRFPEPGFGVTDPPRDLDRFRDDPFKDLFSRGGGRIARAVNPDLALAVAVGPAGLDIDAMNAFGAALLEANPRLDAYGRVRARAHLHASWGFDPTTSRDLTQVVHVVSGAEAVSKRFFILKDIEIGQRIEQRKRTFLDNGSVKEELYSVPLRTRKLLWEALPSGAWLVRHGLSGLYYRLTFAAKTPNLDPKKDEDYELAYQYAVGIDLVTDLGVAANGAEPTDDTSQHTELEVLDLAPQRILTTFYQRSAELDALVAVHDVRRKLVDGIMAGGQVDERRLDAVITRLRDLEIGERAAARAVDALVEEASALGFVLATVDATILPFRDVALSGAFAGGVMPDGSAATSVDDLRKLKFPVTKGGLYRVTDRVAWWNERFERTDVSVSNFLIFQHISLRHSVWTERKERRVIVWEPVRVPASPVSEMVRSLEREGYTTHVLEDGEGGLATAAGETLSEIMLRATVDEAFRKWCALLVPQRETSLKEGSVVVRYLVVRRPLPGWAMAAPPAVLLSEELSYRTRWLGTELGELVQSISLAPAETRRMTITRSFKTKEAERQTVSSLLDVTATSSDDLSSEMERENRRESTDSRSFSANVSGQVSLPVGSVGGGAAFNQSSTTTEVARTLHKVAQKASRSLTERQKLEISVSRESELTTSVDDAVTMELANVNQGSTLNLFFHRLLNIVEAGLHVERLGIRVVSGRELVSGTGIRDTRTLTLRQLHELVPLLAREVSFVGYLDVDVEDFLAETLSAVKAQIEAEYVVEEDASSRSRSAGAFQLAAELAPPADDADRGRLEKLAREIFEWVTRLEVTDRPVSGVARLTLPSGAFYLDGHVGVAGATEPYVDRVREAEHAGRVADARAREARAKVDEALAARLGQPADDRPWERLEVTIDRVARDGQLLVVTLSAPLPLGVWLAEASGRYLASLPVDAAGAELRLPLTTALEQWEGDSRGSFVDVAGRKRIWRRPS